MTDPDRDPLVYIETALELLPDDPSQTSVDDLDRLAAISEGLTRHLLTLRADMAALARRALDAEHDRDALIAIADQRARLEAQHVRALRADERLNKFTADALAAHGFDLDRLVAGE